MSEPIQHKKVKVTATVTATAFVTEYANGETEIDELDEVVEILDYDVIADLD
ncbi:MAG: hypothetical protein HDT30_01095 [Clostridiales bacterium]|nr:hypothetical protein [Clostridiales bacterium]